jgi:transcriptional antiterminator RfaH
VQFGDEPAPVPENIIRSLQEREEAGAFDRVSPQQSLRIGDLVRVTEGAFEDMIGRLVELRDQDRVVVLLDLLGRAVRAHLAGVAVAAA